MTELEWTDFGDRIVKLFPQWKSDEEELRLWKKMLRSVSGQDANRALDRLWETSSRIVPQWTDFKKYLPKRMTTEQTSKPLPEPQCFIQCIASTGRLQAGFFYECPLMRAEEIMGLAVAQHGGEWVIRYARDGWNYKTLRAERHRLYQERKDNARD